MMSTDRELLDEYLTSLADRFYGSEIVERLEEAGILTVREVITALEDYVIEGKSVLDK